MLSADKQLKIPAGGLYTHFWESVQFLQTLDNGDVVDAVLKAFYTNRLHPAYERYIVNLPKGCDIFAFGDAIESINRCLLIHWYNPSRNADIFDFLRPADLVAWIVDCYSSFS